MAGLDFLKEEIADLKNRGVFQPLRVVSGEQLPTCIIDGKKVVNLSSNNYLGLTTHPKMREAMIEATRKYGVGAGAVRPIIGTMDIHIQLEKKLAEFKHMESALVFVAGIAANRGAIQSLLSSRVKGEDDKFVAISDELNHASIIDGVRLTKAQRFIYKHKDMEDLENVLKKVQGAPRILIITDGAFSMDGDIAPLPDIAKLAKKYGAITMVDDAHGEGVLGRNGRGTIDHFRLQGQWDIDMGTMSKAMGCLGGYIAGTKDLTDFLIHTARPFLFSTGHPPGVAAACIAAIEVLETETWRHEKLWENTKFFKEELSKLGLNIGKSETPIVPIIIGDEVLTATFSKKLYEEGVFGLR
ncbi:MAG: aminotransferase class I/II-fold pyridoxal phosphate-dependent enzyme, partial [Planctomycetota bacterium]|nr:aminotransferase class I/II-fold pyridoxal phosphate-dependent enzyme [Planctomycetota bacterium]